MRKSLGQIAYDAHGQYFRVASVAWSMLDRATQKQWAQVAHTISMATLAPLLDEPAESPTRPVTATKEKKP